MSNIRLTYTGLIALLTKLISVITGFVFILIVTRNLTPDEFGSWNLIGGLMWYVLIVEPITSYWVSRHVVRGEQAAKTGLFTNSVFSLGATLGYLLIIYFAAPATHSSYELLLLSTVLVPMNFIGNTLDSINLGFKPHVISYGFLVFELVKIPVGLILVEVLRMGLAGAIIAVFAAYVARNSVAFYFARTKLQGKFDFELVKKWLKLSWLPLYGTAATSITYLDVTVISIILGSVKPLALFGAAITISNVVTHAGVISQALYPKLMVDNKKEYVEYTLRNLFAFGIPIFTAIIVFAKPLLFVLNPIYVVAEPVIYISVVTAFALAVMSTLYYVLIGIERIDVNLQSKFMDYSKSKLFLAPTLYFAKNGTYVVLLALIALIAEPLGIGGINFIVLWAVIGLLTQIPFTAYSWRLAKRYLPFSFPVKNITRYSLAAVVAAIVTFLLNEHILLYNTSIFLFGPRLLAALSIGGAIYFTIAYLTDRDFKTLTKAVIKELFSVSHNKS